MRASSAANNRLRRSGLRRTIRRPRAIRRRGKVKEASSRSVGGLEAAGAERSMIFLTTRSYLRAHYHDWHAACMQLAARRQTPGQGWATWTWGADGPQRRCLGACLCSACWGGREGERHIESACFSAPSAVERVHRKTPRTTPTKLSRAGEKPSCDRRVGLVQPAPLIKRHAQQWDLTNSRPAVPFTAPQLVVQRRP
jgi:hypothetical protein